MNKELITKLNQIKLLVDECLQVAGQTRQKSTSRTAKRTVQSQSQVDLIEIVNKIKSCDESDSIESTILDKSDAANRILLPFYICYKYFQNRRLNSGEISSITSELGIKIKQPNVSKKITRALLKYLDADTTRKKGKATNYKLNRKGAKHFESILNTKESDV